MYFLREVLYLFIVCGLFFIVMLLLYFEIAQLRRENSLLRRIIEEQKQGHRAFLEEGQPIGQESESDPEKGAS